MVKGKGETSLRPTFGIIHITEVQLETSKSKLQQTKQTLENVELKLFVSNDRVSTLNLLEKDVDLTSQVVTCDFDLNF